MDTLTFISNVIRAVAWPLIALAAAVIFRVPIVTLLGRVNEAGLGGLKVNFGKQLDDIEEKLKPEGGSKRVEVDEAVDALKLGLPPSYMINTAWNNLEQKLASIAERLHLGDKRGKFRSIELIASKLGLPPDVIGLVRELRQLRDRAVHGSENEVTDTDALRFQKATASVITKLQSYD